MLREPLVDERVIGAIQIEQASVFLDQAGKEQFGLGAHRLGEILVVVREEVRIRMHFVDVLQAQPLCGESFRQS